MKDDEVNPPDESLLFCPECQGTLSETLLSEDFNTQCPHCGVAVKIPADPELAEKANKEAAERAKAEENRLALIKREAENAKVVAQVKRRVKRTCPHCGSEGTWAVLTQPGVESWIVRCEVPRCEKRFTILNSEDDLLTPLADLLNELERGKLAGILNELEKVKLPGILTELERVRFRIGVLIFFLIVVPLISWIIVAIIRAS